LSTALTMNAIQASGKDGWVQAPSTAACVAEAALGVGLSLAMLTTIVVTFVLVPTRIKKGVSASAYFTWYELVMHNFNTEVLVLDIALGGASVHFTDLPLAMLVGAAYVSFHHFFRYPRTHTLLYFFLSWKIRRGPLIVLALVTAIALFFLAGAFASKHAHPLLLALAPLPMMCLRNPRPDL
jgi:hypothetical protein